MAKTNPFASLAALRDQLPADPVREAAVQAPRDPLCEVLTQKIVVRHERKGRGGRTVTLVQFPTQTLSTELLDVLARELRKGLGTGAQPEPPSTVMVQGEIVDRVMQWLSARGATKLIRGT